MCSGAHWDDIAGIDNFVAVCGLVFGTPRRTDSNVDKSTDVLETGSNWIIPTYSCIVTAEATIKSITFRFNCTDDLSAIKINEIKTRFTRTRIPSLSGGLSDRI